MSAFDPDLVRRVAAALQTSERFIEKDWHLVRALRIVTAIEHPGVTPVFSGGTSLSAAWQLIQRFSEDIDFKVTIDAASKAALDKIRRSYRAAVLTALTSNGFVLERAPEVADGSNFCRLSFKYEAIFPEARGIRPGLKVEMTFSGTHLAAGSRTVQSRLAQATRLEPEIKELLVVDPVETTADKLGALAWRAAKRDRSSEKDDPAIIRHLHDLAALAPTAANSADLRPLARKILAEDAKRAGRPPEEGLVLLGDMLPAIGGDPLWKEEYDSYVGAVLFGVDADKLSFEHAMDRCRTLVDHVLKD